jgi:prepilin-type N-terminal cleavage/methylation domain-containing protein
MRHVTSQRLWHKDRQRGDTLVEVLIAIAVISLVLAGAYVTTNRSLQATRAAQERGHALKLAESQLEQLKSIAVTDPDALFGPGTPMPFCVSQSITIVAAEDEACHVNSAGQPTTTEPIYHLSITRSSGDTFTVTNNWEDPSGRQTDEVRMIYRVHE